MKPKQEARKSSPVTIRLEQTVLERLRALAEERETTVTHIVSSAVDQFLGEGAGSNLLFSKEELAAIVPVAEAIGKPIPLSLFLTIIKTQRGS